MLGEKNNYTPLKITFHFAKSLAHLENLVLEMIVKK